MTSGNRTIFIAKPLVSWICESMCCSADCSNKKSNTNNKSLSWWIRHQIFIKKSSNFIAFMCKNGKTNALLQDMIVWKIKTEKTNGVDVSMDTDKNQCLNVRISEKRKKTSEFLFQFSESRIFNWFLSVTVDTSNDVAVRQNSCTHRLHSCQRTTVH